MQPGSDKWSGDHFLVFRLLAPTSNSASDTGTTRTTRRVGRPSVLMEVCPLFSFLYFQSFKSFTAFNIIWPILSDFQACAEKPFETCKFFSRPICSESESLNGTCACLWHHFYPHFREREWVRTFSLQFQYCRRVTWCPERRIRN